MELKLVLLPDIPTYGYLPLFCLAVSCDGRLVSFFYEKSPSAGKLLTKEPEKNFFEKDLFISFNNEALLFLNAIRVILLPYMKCGI